MSVDLAALAGFAVIAAVMVVVTVIRLLANSIRQVTTWERRNR